MSSSVSEPLPHDRDRRRPQRRAATAERLAAAAVEELRSVGYDGLTVRNVARRAAVAPATAYTYFASKDHLVAEAFGRALAALPPVEVDLKVEPKPKPEAKVDVGPKVEPKPEVEDDVGPKAEDDVGPKAEDDVEPKPEDDVGPKAEDDVGPQVEVEARADSQVGGGASAEGGANTGGEPNADVESDGRRSVAQLVGAAIADVARLCTHEPALAAAATTALLADEPDVARLRRQAGADFHHRFALALGADADPAVLEALDLAFSGALLRAGVGELAYGSLAATMATVAAALTRE